MFSQEIRTFLSNSYACEKVWEQRKRAPIFQKIDYDDLFHQLDRSFQIGQRISVLDIDLFLNGIDSEGYQNELEDVLFKLRLNPESGLLSERTMHAVVRFYIKTGKKKELLNILSNRLNYGIFPDHYVSNMLMDAFLKEGDSTSAVKVAVLQMLQEDFSHPILKSMSLYSCFKYLNSSDVWSPPEEPEIDPDEDEVKIRVNFIRNPYFDDHFDLVDTNHLVGKTMHMAGASYQEPLGPSSQLVGLALHEKRAAIKHFLTKIAANKIALHEDAINKAIEFTKARPKVASEKNKVEDTEEIKADKAEVIDGLEKAKASGNIVPGDLEAVAEAEVLKAVKDHEAKDIESLTKVLHDFPAIFVVLWTAMWKPLFSSSFHCRSKYYICLCDQSLF